MGIFGRLFGKRENNTPTKTLDEIKKYQIDDLNRIIKTLENSDDPTFNKARETVGIFQSNFTKKYKSTKSFCASSDSERRDFLSNLSNILTRFNEMNMNAQALGASLFTIIMYAVEMQDEEFHNEIDNKLIKLFNSR
jgi:hypothetical protein